MQEKKNWNFSLLKENKYLLYVDLQEQEKQLIFDAISFVLFGEASGKK